MILSKKVTIKNSSFYKNKGYISDIAGFIEIKVEDLPKKSCFEILAKCDFCNTEKRVKYMNYNKNIVSQNKFSCSKKCSLIKTKLTNLEKHGYENPFEDLNIKSKIKLTNLEKFGVENPLKNTIILNKLKQTNIEKYGVENVSQNNEVREKVKKINLEKYGVDNYTKTDEYKLKSKKTNLEKYGVEYPIQNSLIKEKVIKTNLEKYGVENPFQNPEIKNKIKLTNLEKYGVEYPIQNNLLKEKAKKTNLEKYGVHNYTKTNEYLVKSKLANLDKFGAEHYKKSEESKINTIIGQHSNYIRYIDNSISLFYCDNNCDHTFNITSENFHSRLKEKLPLCTICFPIGKQISIKEQLIYDYIHLIYNGEIIQSYRDGLEIDIYLPELNIGIEFNGLYWHSNKFKENNYHINKLNFFKEKGIDIKFIIEDDFNNNFNIIKSQIKNWLGKTENKIYARKTTIKQITNVDEYRNFLNNNHIQGFVAGKLSYGLYYDNILVSLMSFDKKEGRVNMEESGWNLNRFCNLLNTNVIGGASKLLSYFIKEKNPKRIISYADKDWSNGHLYFILGFLLIDESKPDYKYIVDGVRKSKQNFTKSKLEKMGHDISLTESKIMESIGINKIYDCGKMKFELII